MELILSDPSTMELSTQVPSVFIHITLWIHLNQPNNAPCPRLVKSSHPMGICAGIENWTQKLNVTQCGVIGKYCMLAFRYNGLLDPSIL